MDNVDIPHKNIALCFNDRLDISVNGAGEDGGFTDDDGALGANY